MTSVLRIAAVSSVLLLAHSIPCAAHPPTITGESAEKALGDEIRAFRKAMSEAIASRNAQRLQEMYGRSFVHQQASGTIGREARIAAALAGDALVESAPATDVSVRAPNDWVAIITGTTTLGAKSAGAARTVTWMAVYTRSGNSWILAASQETAVATNKE